MTLLSPPASPYAANNRDTQIIQPDWQLNPGYADYCCQVAHTV